MKKMFIYRIIINKKSYVGKTTSAKSHKRRNDHLARLKRNAHCNPYLQSAYDKYGQVGFEVLEGPLSCQNLLNQREVFWIKKLNSYNRNFGFNMSLGGEGQSGWVPSLAWREKKSKRMRGVARGEFSQEHKNNLAKARRVWWSENREKGLDIVAKNRKHLTAEKQRKGIEAIQSLFREKPEIRLAGLRKAIEAARQPEVRARATKKIRQMQARKIADQYGNIYESISLAAKKINSSPGNIGKQMSGKIKHNKGYVFREVTNELPR